MLHNSQQGLVVNSVARKKKTERLVPPLIPNHSGLVNGHSSNAGIIGSVNGPPPPMDRGNSMANTPPVIGNNTNNGGFMNSTSLYSPMPIQGNPNGGVQIMDLPETTISVFPIQWEDLMEIA